MKITLSQIRRFTLILIFIFVSGYVGYSLGTKQYFSQVSKNASSNSTEILNKKTPSNKNNIDFSLFWNVWDKLESNYLYRKDLDAKKMVYGAISGMVVSLGDPYTVFLPPTENNATKEDLRGDFEGVGIQIGYNKDQKITVVAPLSESPAEKAGIKTGDVIVKIIDEKNKVDKDTAGLSLPEAVSLIRGKKGTKVTLIIQRGSEKETRTFLLSRETIVVKSAEVAFQSKNNKKVAVLKLSRFGDRTETEWKDAVDAIIKEEQKNKNFSGIIFDLRNNPGGYLQGAVFIGSEFLQSGVVVQQDRGSDGKEQYNINRQGRLLKEPMVVLINGGSASASEIVSGFLKENKRATVVGEKSFGKGTIQEAEDVGDGAGLHITIARWLLPSGKSIDKEGIMPDIEVKINPDEKDQTKDLQLDKALEILTK